jgi:phosphotransferase system  glucose/maltose/N-acetylglucosamine-specific IIC component
MIPIGSRLIWSERFVRGPWHLGVFSRPIAAIAVVWMSFALVIFCLYVTFSAESKRQTTDALALVISILTLVP